MMLTFKEFQNSKRHIQFDELERIFGKGVTGNIGEDISDGAGYLLYADGGGWMSFHDNICFDERVVVLNLERDEYCAKSLLPLERILYFYHYIDNNGFFDLRDDDEDLHRISRDFMDSFSEFVPMSLDEWMSQFGNMLPQVCREMGFRLLEQHFERH